MKVKRLAIVILTALVGVMAVAGMAALLNAGRVQASWRDQPAAAGDVYCVAPGGGGSYPGCNQVFSSVQAAVDAAGGDETIKVAGGTYTGVQVRPAPPGYTGSLVITQVVYLSKTLAIRGGYTTANWATSDPEANPTTLDAEGQGRVLFISGDVSPTIEGLRITGGDAAGLGGDPWGYDTGGGVLVISATATLRDSRVFGNGEPFAGGICLVHSDSTIANNIVAENTGGTGGGLLVIYGAPTIIGNTFIDNRADYAGGVALWASDGVLDGNIVISNSGNIISSLVLLAGSDATLINNVIVNNRTIWPDHGNESIYVGGSSPRLTHNTIARNGGEGDIGLYITDGWGTYSNVVLTDTILVSHAVGIYVVGGNTATLEATLWGTGTWANGRDWAGGGTIVTGTVNVWGNPGFVDPDAGDYHIGLNSAAIDAGLGSGVDADIDGETRPILSGYDIGADELGALLAVTKRASPDPVQSGAPLTYTLWLTNSGVLTLTATVTDVLPPQVTPGGVITWTPVLTASGSVWSDTVVVTVNWGYDGPLTNVVEVTTQRWAAGTDSVTVTVTINKLYLPLLFRS